MPSRRRGLIDPVDLLGRTIMRGLGLEGIKATFASTLMKDSLRCLILDKKIVWIEFKESIIIRC
jgi:hypothetical protein